MLIVTILSQKSIPILYVCSLFFLSPSASVIFHFFFRDTQRTDQQEEDEEEEERSESFSQLFFYYFDSYHCKQLHKSNARCQMLTI